MQGQKKKKNAPKSSSATLATSDESRSKEIPSLEDVKSLKDESSKELEPGKVEKPEKKGKKKNADKGKKNKEEPSEKEKEEDTEKEREPEKKRDGSKRKDLEMKEKEEEKERELEKKKEGSKRKDLEMREKEEEKERELEKKKEGSKRKDLEMREKEEEKERELEKKKEGSKRKDLEMREKEEDTGKKKHTDKRRDSEKEEEKGKDVGKRKDLEIIKESDKEKENEKGKNMSKREAEKKKESEKERLAKEMEKELEKKKEFLRELERINEANKRRDLDKAKELEKGEGKEADERPEKRPKLCCSARLLLSMACFVALFNVSHIRVSISMALVCMVVNSEVGIVSRTQEFNWSASMKGHLMSAAFYGFVFGPFLAGFLSFKFGGKITFIIGTFGSGTSHLFLPEAAKLTPYLFFVARVITGFFASFVYPSFYHLMSNWVIPEEAQLLVTGPLVGIPVSSVANYPISSHLCDWFGWIWLFYIHGIWMIFCGVIFWFSVFEYPDECKFISKHELEFLKSKIPKRPKHKIPWTAIMRSLPIYAYIVMHFCMNYIALNIALSLPLFMGTVYKVPLTSNGLMSATPFLGSLCMRIILCLFFEKIRMRMKLTKNSIRKIFISIGALVASSSLYVVTVITIQSWVLGCLIIALSSLELCITGGYLLSLLDLSPSYVHILTGISNAIGNVAGLIGPVVNGFLTTDGTREEWNIVFYINIFLVIGSTIFYLIFGRNELQPWGLASMYSKDDIRTASRDSMTIIQ